MNVSLLTCKMSSTRGVKFKKPLEIAAIIIFFSAFVFSLSKPISDPDVFWHLKTGEWIWQNKTLSDKDPFSFTIESYQHEKSVRTSFILKQYWLAQLMLYGSYQAGGFYGVILFRCLIYISIVLLLYHWMRKKGLSRITTLMCLIPSIWFPTHLLGERPNNLSFLFAVILVYLLEDLKNNPSLPPLLKWGKGGLLKLITLPLIMLLWANMHGGFILGDAIIVLYMVAEGIKAVYNKVKVKAKVEESLNLNLNLFFLICAISILISFANPNTYKAIFIILELEGTLYSTYSTFVSEMMSPFKYATEGNYQYLIIIVPIVLLFLLRIRQLELNTALLVFFLSFLALTRVRYIPFLLFIAIPFIVGIWSKFFTKVITRAEKFYNLRIAHHAFFYISLLFIFGFSIFLVLSNIKHIVFKNDIISSSYPTEVARFIKTERPDGEIFNNYTWGGYLIWSLYPDYKVFIDGRNLSQFVFQKYSAVVSGSNKDKAGTPEWKVILNEYKVNCIIIPAANIVGGGFTRLVRRLIEDTEWSFVYDDQKVLLFVRDTERNLDIIRKFSRPKMLVYERALEQAETYRIRYPNDWKVYATLGEINLYMEKPAVALLHLESAFRLNPSLRSSSLGDLAERLKTGRDYSKLLDKIFR